MPFDFKKECKELYRRKTKPEIVTVPVAIYIAVKGRGCPNEKRARISGQSAFCMP